jgi:integrase
MDTRTSGFGVEFRHAGASYIVRRRIAGGRQVKRVLFRVGAGSLAEARTQAETLLPQMRKVDLIEQDRADAHAKKRKKAEGITLMQAWEHRADAMRVSGRKRRSERTIASEKYLLEKYLPDWWERELRSITRDECSARFKQIQRDVQRGHYTRASKYHRNHKRGEGSGLTAASAALRSFRATWNHVRKTLLPDLPEAPTASITFPVPEKKLLGLLTPAAAALANKRLATLANTLPPLYAKILADPNPVRRDLWRFMLYTGLRRESACTARWEHVDLDDATLYIPNPKGGKARAFVLPLPACMVEMLRLRKADHAANYSEGSTAPWVFPSMESASGRIAEPKRPDLGIVPHDARRIFATVAESLDLSGYSIKLLMNHALPKADVTGGYMDPDLDRLQAAMTKIADKMTELVTPKPEPVQAAQPKAPAAPSNVVPIRAKKRKTA